jgi:hypothetical protein
MLNIGYFLKIAEVTHILGYMFQLLMFYINFD